MGHWWQVARYDSDPSGRDTEWRCRRCGSTTKFWREPDPRERVHRPGAHDADLNLSYEETQILYTCEELLVLAVHEI